MKFSKDILAIDPAGETERLVSLLRHNMGRVLRRRGAVVGISGGVDSSVVLALCARAFGTDRVTAVMMPEKDSDPDSERLSRSLARHYGVEAVLENITPVLEGFGCYQRRDAAIRRVFPEYDAAVGYKAKIILPDNLIGGTALNLFSLVIITPDGREKCAGLTMPDYLQIVAASNFKQRTRMAMLYFHAELRNYAVIGTANKNEHDQGFFVKYGDGGADIKPIAHLYKTQVYQLAEYLDVPAEIQQRLPTTDTYSAHQSQEEFFFRLPFNIMDLLLKAQEYKIPATQAAATMELTPEQVQRAFNDFSRKRRTTAYLRQPPVEFEPT
jgi:NAD+ synthase